MIKVFGSPVAFSDRTLMRRISKVYLRLHNRVLQKVNGCLFDGADLQQDVA